MKLVLDVGMLMIVDVVLCDFMVVIMVCVELILCSVVGVSLLSLVFVLTSCGNSVCGRLRCLVSVRFYLLDLMLSNLVVEVFVCLVMFCLVS